MSSSQRYTAAEVATALQRSKGFVSRAAEALGCTTQTIYNYRDRYVTVQNAMDESRERRLDYVESKLLECIDQNNVTAIIFFLKTKGKDRGYIERMEHSGPDGEAMQVEVTAADLIREARASLNDDDD